MKLSCIHAQVFRLFGPVQPPNPQDANRTSEAYCASNIALICVATCIRKNYRFITAFKRVLGPSIARGLVQGFTGYFRQLINLFQWFRGLFKENLHPFLSVSSLSRRPLPPSGPTQNHSPGQKGRFYAIGTTERVLLRIAESARSNAFSNLLYSCRFAVIECKPSWKSPLRCRFSPPANETPREMIRCGFSSIFDSTSFPFHVSKNRDSGMSTSLHTPALRSRQRRHRQRSHDANSGTVHHPKRPEAQVQTNAGRSLKSVQFSGALFWDGGAVLSSNPQH